MPLRLKLHSSVFSEAVTINQRVNVPERVVVEDLYRNEYLNQTACAVAFIGHFRPADLAPVLFAIDGGAFGPVKCHRGWAEDSHGFTNGKSAILAALNIKEKGTHSWLLNELRRDYLAWYRQSRRPGNDLTTNGLAKTLMEFRGLPKRLVSERRTMTFAMLRYATSMVILREPLDRTWSHHYFFHGHPNGRGFGGPEEGLVRDPKAVRTLKDPGFSLLVDTFGAEAAIAATLSETSLFEKIPRKRDGVYPLVQSNNGGRSLWSEVTKGNIQTEYFSRGLLSPEQADAEESLQMAKQVLSLCQTFVYDSFKARGVLRPETWLKTKFPSFNEEMV